MMHAESQRGRARWMALAAILVLIAGLSLAWWHWQAPRPEKREAPPRVDLDPDAGVIQRALDLGDGAADSAALKARWVNEIPHFDVSALSPSQREIFIRFANAERCTCGCGYTLAACRVYDSTCEVSAPRVRALLDSVRAGRITSASGIRKRPA